MTADDFAMDSQGKLQLSPFSLCVKWLFRFARTVPQPPTARRWRERHTDLGLG
jgi:hypothetical protein